MAKDPAFLFYPGDYLRDTQCLNEQAQVAYDRIMCEHMRNISSDMNNIGITQDKLNFFTKRMDESVKSDLLHVLKKNGNLFQIEWVALSICNRKTYSDGRAKNRTKKNEEHVLSHDKHMENENEIINEIVNYTQEGGMGETQLCPEMIKIFKDVYPEYPEDEKIDPSHCLQIAYKIANAKKWTKESVTNGKMNDTLLSWRAIVVFSKSDSWFSGRAISDFNKEYQRLIQKMVNNGTHKPIAGKDNITPQILPPGSRGQL
jgi:hypothetical protein